MTEDELRKWKDVTLNYAQGESGYRHLSVVASLASVWGQRAGLTTNNVRLLEAAGLLHDIGKYAARFRTGFHPFDGAHLVASLGGEDRLVNLIANHTGSRYEAVIMGRDPNEFPYVGDQLDHILMMADLHTDADGCVVGLTGRKDGINQRYSDDSPQAMALQRLWPEVMEIYEELLKGGILRRS